MGAKVAYFFLDKTFGLASFIIPVFLVMLGMRLMRVYKVRIVRWFILLSLLLVWTSVFLAAMAGMMPVFDESFINPGGNHGKFVANWLTSLIGRPGLCGVLLLFAVFYLIYISKKTIEFIRGLFRLNIYKKLKFERKKKDEDESDEQDETVVDVQPDPVEFNNPQTQVLDFGMVGEDNLNDEVLTLEDETKDNDTSKEKVEKDRKLTDKAKGYTLLIILMSITIAGFAFSEIIPNTPEGIIRIGTGIYTVLICTMLVLALLQRSSLYALGALLFVFSDFILAWNKFTSPIENAGLLIMIPYYLGQWLIYIRSTPFRVGPEMRLMRF